MRISRSSRCGDDFYDALKKVAKKIPGSDQHIDERLDGHRDSHGHEHEGGTEEVILADDRKGDKTIGERLIEKNLRKEYSGPDKEPEGITEKQLNDTKKANYPHRNPKAYQRAGDKRPVNALDEEMGKAGDASKLERYEKESKGKADRILDKNIGKQLDNEKTKIKNAFNLKASKQAAIERLAGDYLSYKGKEKPFNKKFAEVSKMDEAMTSILETASREDRNLSDDEKARISALKFRKSEILKVAQFGMDDMDMDMDMDMDDDAFSEAEMSDGVVISSAGPLGSQYSVSAGGKHIGSFPGWDEAIGAATTWMDKNQYWPNLYFVNDHGNVDLLDSSGQIIESRV